MIPTYVLIGQVETLLDTINKEDVSEHFTADDIKSPFSELSSNFLQKTLLMTRSNL
jgi:hypothetical protein